MESSLPWANSGVGDGQAYDDDEWSDWQRKAFTSDRTTQGVIAGYSSQLELSNPAGNTIRVSPGAAWVDGKFYETDADVDNTVTTPGAGSNYYRFVLRKTWAAQTVRVAVLGPDTVSPPTVTQSDGSVWEISLGTVQVTSGGVITVTDTRYFASSGLSAPLVARQGGSSSDWGTTPGTTDYTPAAPFMQCGMIQWTGAAAANGSKVITFPRAFNKVPLVFIQATDANVTTALFDPDVSVPTFSWADQAGTTRTDLEFYWWAIGE